MITQQQITGCWHFPLAVTLVQWSVRRMLTVNPCTFRVQQGFYFCAFFVLWVNFSWEFIYKIANPVTTDDFTGVTEKSFGKFKSSRGWAVGHLEVGIWSWGSPLTLLFFIFDLYQIRELILSCDIFLDLEGWGQNYDWNPGFWNEAAWVINLTSSHLRFTVLGILLNV